MARTKGMKKETKSMEKAIFKTDKDFGGYWIKGLKNFKGHEGEPLFQCSVYKDGKRIGFFSEDSWGGPAQLQEFKKEDEANLCEYAKTMANSEYSEEYHLFIAKIADVIHETKYFKTKCRTKVLFRIKSDDDDGFRTLNVLWKDNRNQATSYLDKNYGEGNYIILNKEFERK